MSKTGNILLLGILVLVAACTDVTMQPKSTITSAVVFNDPGSYKAFIAKVYSGLALSGQQGPAGDADIKGIDEGFSNYWRQYWGAQEFPTDEAVIGWGDAGLPDFHEHDWTASNQFVTALYNRVFFQVSMANEFLRETTEEKLNARGVSSNLKAEVMQYRAEARFLRALSYWHGIDLFSAIPLITENDPIGTVAPKQSTRADIFNYVEQELKDIENSLAAPGQVAYGRADQAAAWTLLAKLYLNAQVYIGQPKYTEAITYAKKVIDSGQYSLDPSYQHLFMADNNTSNEIIFPIAFDGAHTQSWGGMCFLIHAAVGGSMNPAKYGVDGGWWGSRTTSSLVNLFPDATGTIDSRAIFYTDGQTKDINSITDFTNGYAVPKYVNVDSQGNPGKDLSFPDTDVPMFRLADVYLMYAEAVLRGGTGGSRAQALQYINALRGRAYGNTNGNITDAQLTLNFILDERARELYWEGYRRTDLIRFNQFTENGIWPWKGGVKEGKTTESYRNIYPIPSSELIANPGLTQNKGY